MAWGGSSSWAIYEDYFILTSTGFDADLEDTAALHLPEYLPFIPSHYSFYVTRSGGTTDGVSVVLEGVDAGETSAYAIGTVTDSRGAGYTKGSTTDYTSATGKLSEHLFDYIRVTVTTVGAGNTLTVTVIGRR